MVSMGTGRPGPHRLVEEDVLLDGRAALAPVLGGPADAQPAVLGHLLDHPPHVGADPVAVGQLGLDLGGEQVGVVLAEAVPESLLVPRCSRSPWGPSRSCVTVRLRGRHRVRPLDWYGAWRTARARRRAEPLAAPRPARRRRWPTTRTRYIRPSAGRHRSTRRTGAPAASCGRSHRHRRPIGSPVRSARHPATTARSPHRYQLRRIHRVSPSRAAPPPSPEEHHMPEAVIVATGRTPIGRANKGSLVDCRPDDLAALVIREVLAKVPATRPPVGRGRASWARASPAARPATTSAGWPPCWPGCPTCPG